MYRLTRNSGPIQQGGKDGNTGHPLPHRALSQAGLRINDSLDLDAVFQGVIDSDRYLAGASYGRISTMDKAGRDGDLMGMARGNFEPESSHFQHVGQLRPLGCRFALWLGEGDQIARMGTFGVKVPM